MAKGKKLLFWTAVSAAAAGAYYLYKKNTSEIPVDMEEEDDVETFGDEVDIDAKPEKRPYVSLDFNTVEQKVQDAASKVVDVAGKAATSIGNILKQGEERVEEFFDDRKIQVSEVENSVEDYVEETAEAVEEAVEEVAEEVTGEEINF